MSHDYYIGMTTKSAHWLLQWLVPIVTGSKWMHVWIEYPSEDWGGEWIAHATNDGVVKVPAEPYIAKVKTQGEIKRYKIVGIDPRVGMKSSRELVGLEYDYKSLAWNMFVLLLYRLFGRHVIGPALDRTKMTCSEFIAYILQGSGILDQDAEPEFFSPGDIEAFCEKSPHLELCQDQ
jgi:hypothetical protein